MSATASGTDYSRSAAVHAFNTSSLRVFLENSNPGRLAIRVELNDVKHTIVVFPSVQQRVPNRATKEHLLGEGQVRGKFQPTFKVAA